MAAEFSRRQQLISIRMVICTDQGKDLDPLLHSVFSVLPDLMIGRCALMRAGARVSESAQFLPLKFKLVKDRLVGLVFLVIQGETGRLQQPLVVFKSLLPHSAQICDGMPGIETCVQ